MDVPYERLGIKPPINYIPMKMAINDVGGNAVSSKSRQGEQNLAATDTNFDDYARFINGRGDGFEEGVLYNNTNAILIALVSVACVLVIFYVIYIIYISIILRERQSKIAAQQKFF
ncbi:hypothetical protein [Orgyia leucostigma nucleopolyhedrovirus]|uniref:Ac78 n=1 Tax=Orgyia leucostigma nucleopolyhedrovirus TaxID=490711 RepID=B0FDT9_9ABAC|nr:hypothetical protein [Orgyia leucostigma nucleopolyhedrovirus]ABY65797.1 hypothetical protein [Orgyia leucostigma nucleopolyhedrovirus]